MTLEELEGTLPNGFHDAILHRISWSLETAELVLELSIYTGDPEGASRHARERYRRASIRIERGRLLEIEPPRSAGETSEVTIDAGAGRIPDATRDSGVPVEKGAFLYWIFVNEWNSFLQLSGIRADVTWID